MTSLPRMRTTRMRNARLVLGMAMVAVLAACTSVPRVRTDMDPRANFAQYTTFAFYKPLSMESAGYSTFLTESIRASVRQQMEARGYRYDDAAPGLRINFQAVVRERIDVLNAPGGSFGWGGWGGGWGGGRWGGGYGGAWGGGPWGGPFWGSPQVRQFNEGTLVLDFVDSTVNHLVWTGSASSQVSGQRTQQERAAEVDRAINAVFAQFPFNAGSAQGNLVPAK